MNNELTKEDYELLVVLISWIKNNIPDDDDKISCLLEKLKLLLKRASCIYRH